MVTVTFWTPYTHCYKFSSRYSIRLTIYGLHMDSLRNLSTGRNSKNKQGGSNHFYMLHKT